MDTDTNLLTASHNRVGIACYSGMLVRHLPIFVLRGRPLGIQCEPSPFRDHPIGQRQQGEKLRRVLGQALGLALVGILVVPEQVLDIVEWVQGLRPHCRFALLDHVVHAPHCIVRQRPALRSGRRAIGQATRASWFSSRFSTPYFSTP